MDSVGFETFINLWVPDDRNHYHFLKKARRTLLHGIGYIRIQISLPLRLRVVSTYVEVG
jgi:hypothetical protein